MLVDLAIFGVLLVFCGWLLKVMFDVKESLKKLETNVEVLMELFSSKGNTPPHQPETGRLPDVSDISKE